MPNFRSETLAVVVPATDDPPSLALCVDALQASTEPPDQLLVVDAPPGASPAAARNRGALETDCDLVAFVDADVVVDSEALARLRDRLAADPELTAVFGSYDDSPPAPGTVSRFRNLLHHHVHTSSPGPAETFWAGLGAVRRDAFLAVGGFDAERFPEPSVEDIELGIRLRRAGERIVLDPSIRGTHLKRWSLRSMVDTDLRRRGVPWTRIALEQGGRSQVLNLGWRHRVSALAAVVVAGAALARRPRIALAALALTAWLNRSLYALLARRGGPGLAVAGVGLHLIHQLTAAISAAVGAAAHLLAGRPAGSR
jgi:GT2 family glycosyltransferase